MTLYSKQNKYIRKRDVYGEVELKLIITTATIVNQLTKIAVFIIHRTSSYIKLLCVAVTVNEPTAEETEKSHTYQHTTHS